MPGVLGNVVISVHYLVILSQMYFIIKKLKTKITGLNLICTDKIYQTYSQTCEYLTTQN